MSNLSESEKEAQKMILGEIDKAFDLLEKHLQKYCKEVAPKYNGGKQVQDVPMIYIEQSIKIIKDNMKKGAGL
jgi:hypothetical protein